MTNYIQSLSLSLFALSLLLLPSNQPSPAMMPTVDSWRTYLIQDLNPTTADANPRHLTVVGDSLYFTIKGTELWVLDGSISDPRMVKDFSFPSGQLFGEDTAAFNGDFYFSVYSEEYGLELWRSDGSEAGTQLVKDIHPNGDSLPENLTVAGGRLFFVAQHPDVGRELWATDGTNTGTYLVKDIRQGTSVVHLEEMIAVNDTLFFSAIDDVYGQELWRSDGTEEGTVMVKDISPGTSWSRPSNFVQMGETLYFSAWTVDSGFELWRSDGSSAGTYLLKEISIGSNTTTPSQGVVVDGQLYFASYSESGDALWISDGTEAGTRIVTDQLTQPQNLIAVGQTLYFAASSSEVGEEVWKADGASVTLLKDIYPGAAGSEPRLLAARGDGLFFEVRSSQDVIGLWFTDGTEDGTRLVKTLPLIDDFAVYENRFYMAVTSGLEGNELWVSDGTALGTDLVADLNPLGLDSSPSDLTVVGNALYFTAETGSGRRLFRSEGHAGNTVIITGYDIDEDEPSFTNFAHVGRTFYFSTTVNGRFFLWKVEATENKANLVKEFAASCASDSTAEAVGGVLYFTARDDAGVCSLWQSDGSDAGTYLVSKVSIYVRELTAVEDTLFFVNYHDDSGHEIWRSDGTEAGTYLVKNINPSSSLMTYPFPGQLTASSGLLFFEWTDWVAGYELWRTDGTEAGTFLTRDIYEGLGNAKVRELTSFGNLLYFSANSVGFGRELWRSDGTTTGTWQVADIVSGLWSSFPRDFEAMGDQLFFVANQAFWDASLWFLNNEDEMVQLVIEAEPDGVQEMEELTAVSDTLFFTGTYQNDGRELWLTDGTAEGTRLAADLAPNGDALAGSEPADLTQVGNSLYFTASDHGQFGRELWRTARLAIEMVPQSAAIIPEQGGTAVYTVVPTAPPTAPLTIELTADSQTTVSPTTLIFTPENWHEAQTVTITAVNDDIAEGRHSSTIIHTIESNDDDYVALGNFTYIVALIDDEIRSAASIYLPMTQNAVAWWHRDREN